MLVAVRHDVALAVGNGDGNDLAAEIAGVLRRLGAHLAAQGESVLIGARDGEIRGDILAGLTHRFGAVKLLHLRIDEAPAQCGVVHLGIAGEGRGTFADHEGRTGHALDAAGQNQLGIAGADHARRRAHRVEP